MPNGDTHKQVRPGDPLRIGADVWNALLGTLRRDQLSRLQLGGQGAPQLSEQTSIVRIRNDSGTDQGRYAILGIDGVLVDRATNADTFDAHVLLKGSTPDAEAHLGNFVILAEPILNGQIGRAYAAGALAQVQIDVTNADHRFAEIIDSDAAKLRSADWGTCQILHAETGTGTQWALVKLGSLYERLTSLELFTANGTFTTPPHPTQILCVVVGAGGGGGGGGASSTPSTNSADGHTHTMNFSGAGGGGGGGGHTVAQWIMAPPSTNFTVSIGAGGAGGAAGAAGSTGGTTSIDPLTYYWNWPAYATTTDFINAVGGNPGGAGSSARPGRGGAGGSASAIADPNGSTRSRQVWSRHGHHGGHGTAGVPGFGGNGLGGRGAMPALPLTDAGGVDRGLGGDGGDAADAGLAGADGYVLFIW